MARILVVEDNVDLANGLSENLTFEGFEVSVALDGRSGLEQARATDPDLIILDALLPTMDGFRVLHTLRNEGNTVPVLMLTARGEEVDKVRGFRFGADDYVTKPFGLLELLGRVNALLRRARTPHRPRRHAGALTAQTAAAAFTGPLAETVRFGDIEVVPSTRSVYRRGFPVVLRPMEYELLLALLLRRGEVAARGDLMRDVWGYATDIVSRTLDTHIAELRRKLEEDPSQPRYLLTVRKTGYRLRID